MLLMIPPNNESVSQISRDSGLAEATLYNVAKGSTSERFAVPGGEKETEKWST